MRFIHAADVHLDSPLHGLADYPDAPAHLLRSATRRAFENLVDLAIEDAVDFMVIAGDLYDGGWRDHNTGIFFVEQMGRLKKAGIPVFVLFGNHDAESEMTKKLQLPENVSCFPTRAAKTFTLDRLKVALHGHSFKDKAVTDNLALSYPSPVAGYFNIGVLHTALEGKHQHANYAPCSVDELHARGYGYWALGHVHEYTVWEGPSTIVFPGNLQGRQIREQGEKGAVRVTVDEGGAVQVERLIVDVLRWHALEVDVGGCADLAEVVGVAGRALEALADAQSSRPNAVRLVLTGRTGAHGELFAGSAQLRQEMLARVAALGNERVWLEKVQVRTSPAIDEAELRQRKDAIADLQDLLKEAQSDPEFLAGLQQDLAAFLGKLPSDLMQEWPEFKALRDGKLDELVQEVAPALLAHLAEGEKA